MKYRRNNCVPRRRKRVKKRNKRFKDLLKQFSEEFAAYQLQHININKELAEKNVSLLAEIETLKREKLEIFESLMFKRSVSSSIIKNELIVLLESLKQDHKYMVELFYKTNDSYNKTIDNINNKIEELVKTEQNSETIAGPSEDRTNSQTLFEMKRQSRQNNCQHNDNEENELRLSVIREATQELSQSYDSENQSDFRSACSEVQSPKCGDRQSVNSVNNYQMTPNLSQYMRTPSIYNFNSKDFTIQSDQSSTSPYTLSLKELSLTNFESFNTTLTEDPNLMTTSTPLNQMRSSPSDMIQSRQKRLSSIARPYSPRLERQSPKRKQSLIGRQSAIGRPSLLEIQNIIDNKKRKKCSKVINTKTISASSSSQTNGLNTTDKQEVKNCQTLSLDSNSFEDSANQSRSRRTRKQVCYKEPALKNKLRR